MARPDVFLPTSNVPEAAQGIAPKDRGVTTFTRPDRTGAPLQLGEFTPGSLKDTPVAIFDKGLNVSSVSAGEKNVSPGSEGATVCTWQSCCGGL